jgi:hypothetical protein
MPIEMWGSIRTRTPDLVGGRDFSEERREPHCNLLNWTRTLANTTLDSLCQTAMEFLR